MLRSENAWCRYARKPVTLLLREYADRLPRWNFSRCPLTGALFKSAIDPFGFEGPFWEDCRSFTIDQPQPPRTYKLHLGAMRLHGREPGESGNFQILAGPEVPHVVPRLMRLPDMHAVISSFDLQTRDTCYIITYFSTADIAPGELHSSWLEREYWFTGSDGKTCWTTCGDAWDFDLGPWIDAGRLHWIEKGDENRTVRSAADGQGLCPYLDLRGERRIQVISGGIDFEDPPSEDGDSRNPFANQ